MCVLDVCAGSAVQRLEGMRVSREWGTKQGEVSLLMVSATSSGFEVLPVDRKDVCGGGDN